MKEKRRLASLPPPDPVKLNAKKVMKVKKMANKKKKENKHQFDEDDK